MSWEIEFLLWLQKVIPFKQLFSWITHLGDAGILFIVIGLYLLFIKKDKKQAFHLFGAMLLMMVIVNIGIKPLVGRVRPFDVYPMDLLIKAPQLPSSCNYQSQTSFLWIFHPRMQEQDRRFR